MEDYNRNSQKYVVYEYIYGIRNGERFVKLSTTHYEEEGKIIRRFDGVTRKEVAEKIVERHNNKLVPKLIRGLRKIIFD